MIPRSVLRNHGSSFEFIAKIVRTFYLLHPFDNFITEDKI